MKKQIVEDINLPTKKIKVCWADGIPRVVDGLEFDKEYYTHLLLIDEDEKTINAFIDKWIKYLRQYNVLIFFIELKTMKCYCVYSKFPIEIEEEFVNLITDEEVSRLVGLIESGCNI